MNGPLLRYSPNNSGQTVTPARKVKVEIRKRYRWILIIYAIMISSWILDFKSEGAGQGLAMQAIFSAFYITFAGSFTVINRSRSKGLSFIILALCTVIFLATAITTSIVYNADIYNTMRNVIPIVLYITAASASYSIVFEMKDNLRALRQCMATVALAYMISAFFVIYFSKGVNFSTIRYEIIGGSIVFGVSYAVMMMRFKLIPIEIIMVFISVLIISLSVTRTWIAVAAVEFMLVLVFVVKMRPGFIVRIFMVGAVLAIGVATLQLSGVPVLDRWTQRIFSNQFSVDPTSLSRERQNNSMLDSISQRPFFGAGLSGESRFWLEKNLGGSNEISRAYGFGHNQHLSMLFIGGIFGGLPLLLLQFWQSASAVIFMRKTRWYRESDLVFFGVLSGLVICGTLAYGMLGGTFGDRELALWYGVGTGLFLATRDIWGKLARVVRRRVNIKTL
ncbi:O-antigen ligase family protein [Sphingomonas sp. LH128]|uniref:O-antigen ligase family protein n=1 Tax=Sphingomonas sp. LH128 TaxID=473781 RepID=UPI000309224A|nr:O-antigen ligase family protein [Sphingomonas sp. LH128]